jgi:NAD(P)-dependent dehydrogenase (short-subunit alcohol dehydrogenase family)
MPCADADSFLPDQMTIFSTVPPNGDLNPYGVAFVPQGFQGGTGPLRPGQILVSNFNNNMNLQGTGTTVVRVSASGKPAVFFAGPPHPGGSSGLGLSTALAVLRNGFVIVGNVPSRDGTAATVTSGSLLVINNEGHLVSTISGPEIVGPWDMTVFDEGNQAIAFVSMVLSGRVVRLNLDVSATDVTVTSKTVIAAGYEHRADPVAFEVGPTGLVYDPIPDVLYVASTADNAVFAVQNAATRGNSGSRGTVIYTDANHLHGPLGMAEAPNGHLLVANSDVINSNPHLPSEIVEFTKQGQFVGQLSVDPLQGGSFGLAVNVNDGESFFAAVDDNTATLTLWRMPLSDDP